MQLTATAKILRSNLNTLNSSLSTTDLVANVAALESEKAEIEARLESLRLGKAKKVTKEEREQTEKDWKKAVRVARKRQAIAREMWFWIADRLTTDEEKVEAREKLGLDD